MHMLQDLHAVVVHEFYQRCFDEDAMPGEEDDMKELTDECVSLNHQRDGLMLAAALELEKRGLAECKLRLPERSLWKCTESARSRLCPSQHLSVVGPALRAVPGRPLKDMCAWELLYTLVEHARHLQVLKKGARMSALTPYKPGKEKAFYVRAAYSTFPRPYMIALANADRNNAEVPHMCSAQNYKDMFPDLLPQKDLNALKDSEVLAPDDLMVVDADAPEVPQLKDADGDSDVHGGESDFGDIGGSASDNGGSLKQDKTSS